jgi:hypothetical protein
VSGLGSDRGQTGQGGHSLLREVTDKLLFAANEKVNHLIF